MSLNDWTSYKDGGESSESILGLVYTDIMTPLFGTGSIRLTHSPTDEFQVINLVPATAPTGFRAGRMRSIIRLDDFDDSGNPTLTHENYAGFLMMQSTENMSLMGTWGGTGESYKFTAGVDGSSGSLPAAQRLAQVNVPFSLVQGSAYGFEVLWRTEQEILDDLGGAYFSIRIGEALDFSDLIEVLTYIDASAPYTVSVAESIWAGFKNTSVLSSNVVTFDNTSLYSISIA
jgi:hypothetical protein